MARRTVSGRQHHSVWPHRLAVLTAGATLPLLFVGGLVTSKGAGLAVPDWPTTFGHSMFLYPWSQMVGNIFYEHSHRLIASGVGMLTILLALALWIGEGRRWLRWLGLGALALVILQGVIGGLRVVLLDGTLAILHAGLAQAFFALAVSLAFFTSGVWMGPVQTIRAPQAHRLRILCVLTTGVIYTQAVSGAFLRHTGSGLELHLLLAFLAAGHVYLLAVRVWRFFPVEAKLRRPASLLVALLIVQLVLGVSSYFGKFSSFGILWNAPVVVGVTTTHVVVGALVLVTSLALTLRSFRFLEPEESAGSLSLFSKKVSA